MRIFKTYTPLLIAKYVSAFFKGEFMVQGFGVFSFDKGKVVIDSKLNALELAVCKEVNACIASFSRKVS